MRRANGIDTVRPIEGLYLSVAGGPDASKAHEFLSSSDRRSFWSVTRVAPGSAVGSGRAGYAEPAAGSSKFPGLCPRRDCNQRRYQPADWQRAGTDIRLGRASFSVDEAGRQIPF